MFKTLAVVIDTQLLIYSLAAGVCGQRALEELQGCFDSTLNLPLALLGGVGMTRMERLRLDRASGGAETDSAVKPRNRRSPRCCASPR